MKQFLKTKRHMKWYWTLLSMGAMGAMILFTCVALQAGSVAATFRNFLLHPLLLVWNALPIGVVLCLLYAIFGNVFYAGAGTSLLFNLLSLVNLIKIEGRNDPLVPADFGLLTEALQATGEYQLDLHIPYFAAIVFLAAALIVCGVKLKSARPGVLWRIAIAAASVGVFALSMATIYRDKDTYTRYVNNTPHVVASNVPTVFDGLGFNYCFLYFFTQYEVTKPEGYSRAEAMQWNTETLPQQGEPIPAHVVFVQCEAFSDIMAEDVFAYAPEDDPLADYKEVAASDQALAGHIIVSNYGAGTANTEFDIMTGMQTNMISDSMASAFRAVHKSMPSLARIFRAQGYQTYFMHPGTNWFYNRENVYDYFGISDRTFVDAFSGSEYKGSFVSDEAFRQHLLADFTARTEASDAPFFGFTVTIQNHQAYPYSKYDFRVPDVPLRQTVSDETKEMLSVYAQGIRDSSVLLRELTESFDELDEPLLLVFWGDHLPALGGSFQGYQEIGLDIGYETTPKGTFNTYKTPFVLWANDAFCSAYDFAARTAALELPEEPLLSDIYLGELVYELLNLQGTDAYFDFLGQARRQLPAIYRSCYALSDGTLTFELPQELQPLIEKLSRWEYYRLIEEPVN